jgi:hypothetical protein
MSLLKGLQADFKSFLLRGDERMLERVVGSAKVSAPRRLAIYYDAYRLRLIEALDSNYPVLHAWMGDDEFEHLGLAYLEAHPSTHFSIRYFGDRLSEYLASAENYRDKPFLGEMAALEWAMSEAFDAPDSPGVDLDAMASIPPEAWPEMRLTLHASVYRLDLRWNVPAIWKAIKEEQAPGEPAAGEWPQPWLVWRQDLKIFFRSLSVDEAWAIDAVRKGETFASICEGLVEWIDTQNVALQAAGLLKRWIIDGMITSITPGNP